MRILRIALKNITSLEGTHVVDFTREPLKSAGLFSISGPTGSGKSTLLDALCLALYEKTPRLQMVRGGAKLKDGEDEITQAHPGNLLRRGCGEGFAEVAFVGVDGEAYTARWMARRARGRADGALQNSEMVLLRGVAEVGELGSVVQGGKKTEVKPAIEQRVGLTFEQFTRAVLLAQNDFATFLKADDKERAEILQALTGTEQFERLSQSIYVRCQEKVNAAREIAQQLDCNRSCSAEERAELDAKAATAASGLEAVEATIKQLDVGLTWFTREAELHAAVHAAESTCAGALREQQEAAPRRRELEHATKIQCDARPLWEAEVRAKAEVAAGENAANDAARQLARATEAVAAGQAAFHQAEKESAETINVREELEPQLKAARDLDSQLVPLRERLGATVRAREEAQKLHHELNLNLEKCNRERERLERARDANALQLQRLADVAPFTADARAWEDRLDRAAVSHRALREAEAELEQRRKDAQAKSIRLAVDEEQFAAKEAASAKAQEALDQAVVNAKAFDAESMASERRTLEEVRTALQQLQAHLQECATATERVEKLRAEIDELQSRLQVNSERQRALKETELPGSVEAEATARRALELAEAAAGEAAVSLRRKLLAGEACPVCGSTEHPYSQHAEAVESSVVAAFRKEHAAKAQRLKELAAESGALERIHKEHLETLQKRKAEQLTMHARCEELGAYSPPHASAREILELPAATDRAIAAANALSALQKKRVTLEKAESSRLLAEREVERCRKVRDTVGEEVAASRNRIHAARAELLRSKTLLETAEENVTRARTASAEHTAVLAPLFPPDNAARAAWETDPLAWRTSFMERLHDCKRQWEAADEIKVQLQTARANAERTAAETAAAAKVLEERSAEERQVKGTCDAAQHARTKLIGGQPADEVEKQAVTAVEQAALRLEAARRSRDAAVQQQAVAMEAVKLQDTELARRRSMLEAAAKALDAWLHAFGGQHEILLHRSHVAEILQREEAWFDNERMALAAIDRAVDTARAAVVTQQANAAQHARTRPTELSRETLLAARGEAAQEHAERKAAYENARAEQIADDQRKQQNATLNAEWQEKLTEAAPWERLSDLIGSADGAKFRNVAQRRTLDVLLRNANAQLEMLAPRYRLERIPESLNLLVLDGEMGDERRSVHSLSGGESFLVSLALALALASITSNRVRIESLFIDEGFGSLDPETLNVAMGALMQLEAQGRKVGVISHVPEMADAIPVQIRVVRGRGGASRLHVPGAAPEMAVESLYGDSPSSDTAFEPAGDVAEQIVAILMRQAEAGQPRVSVRALREEIGCSESACGIL